MEINMSKPTSVENLLHDFAEGLHEYANGRANGLVYSQRLDEAKAKINRLIVEAYNNGYSACRGQQPKYKVGDVNGNYEITERFRRVGKNTKYKVVCTLCGAPMFRYSNRFKLKHKNCGAIKND